MILSDKAAAARLGSSNNLMNRLSELKSTRKNAMSLFVPSSTRKESAKQEEKKELKFNPFATASPSSANDDEKEQNDSIVPVNPTVVPNPAAVPKIEDLVTNSDEQVRLGLAHDKALSVLTKTLITLDDKVGELHPSKLPSAIIATAKVVESIRRERLEAAKQGGRDREVHYHFYTPQQRKISDYEIIEVQAEAVP
jgi:hypothetical protein